MISSPDQVGMVLDVDHDHALDELQPFLTQVDMVLAEGYKREKQEKIEVFRSEISPEPLCRGDSHLVGFVSDVPADLGVPRFSPDDVEELADFLVERYSLVRTVSNKIQEAVS
jgi:molybdopterin-guanine dinucleotide biosynthesis protein B